MAKAKRASARWKGAHGLNAAPRHASFLATLSEEFSTNACGLCAVLTLMNGLCAKSAGSASNYPVGAKDVEKRLSSHAFWLRLHVVVRIALAAGVYGIHVAGMEDRPCLSQPFSALSGAYLLGKARRRVCKARRAAAQQGQMIEFGRFHVEE